MRFNSALRLWRSFRRLPGTRRWLVIEAAFWLPAAQLALFLLPFPRIARYLGHLRSAELSEPGAEFSGSGETVAAEIAWAIERASRLLPYKPVCLPRALAGWQMLHRRGILGHLHFGASRNEARAQFRGHAWLDACGVEVTGYPQASDCVEIGYFQR